MVFFVCDGCNETLKKNQVDKHAGRCRQCYSVTCVDCNQTFPGNEYVHHVSCITEAEKYQKSLFQGKKSTKLNPQELWAATIQEAANNSHKAPSNIQHYLPRIAESGNVPRNKNKFMNFAKNSLKLNSTPVLESIWNFLESFKPSPQQTLEPEQSTSVDAVKPTEVQITENIIKDCSSEQTKEKKKKKKVETDDLVEQEPPTPEVSMEETKETKKKKKKGEEKDVATPIDTKSKEKKKRKVEETPMDETETSERKSKKKKKSKIETSG